MRRNQKAVLSCCRLSVARLCPKPLLRYSHSGLSHTSSDKLMRGGGGQKGVLTRFEEEAHDFIIPYAP